MQLEHGTVCRSRAIGQEPGYVYEHDQPNGAVERDPVMIRHLENDLLPVSNNRLHLLEGDAIEKPRASLPNGQPFKVVANLPYAITTPWLESIIKDPLPSRMVLLVQKEAAQRVLANHGTNGNNEARL